MLSCSRALENKTEDYLGHFTCWATQDEDDDRRDNGEDGKTENTQGRPESSYSLQELLIFPQPMDTYAIISVISLHLTFNSFYNFSDIGLEFLKIFAMRTSHKPILQHYAHMTPRGGGTIHILGTGTRLTPRPFTKNASSIYLPEQTALPKIGIKCFSRFLLVAHGRKPSNPHFHGPIRRRISEEDRRNV